MTVRTIALLILFFISNIGLCESVRRYCKVHICFIPGIVVAIETTILFCAGLLNILLETAILIYICGFAGIVFLIVTNLQSGGVKKLLTSFAVYKQPCFLFLAVGICLFFFFFQDKVFSSTDNFTHWAVVVKSLLKTNRFPNFQDTIITFKEYPLGSSSYIYFFSRFIDSTEPIQMLAQMYMMLVSIMPLFYFVRRNQFAGFILIVTASNLFFLLNIPITELMVDSLLPLVSMAGLLFSYIYCGEQNNRKNVIISGLYMIQMVQIKNSGFFFASLAIALLVKQSRQDKQLIKRMPAILLSLASFWLWHKHCKYVFNNATVSSHAMTMDRYSMILSEKTSEQIRAIIHEITRRSISNSKTIITLGFLLIIGFLCFLCLKNEWRRYLKISIIVIFVYLAYQLGMMGMYIFSMPASQLFPNASNNTVSLTSYSRYLWTILLAIVYFISIYLIKIVDGIQTNKHEMVSITVSGIFCILICLYMYLTKGNIRLCTEYYDKQRDPSEHRWLDAIKAEYNIPEGSSCAILVPDEAIRPYTRVLGRYVFMSDKVDGYVITKPAEMDDLSGEYILLYDENNEIINCWVHDYAPEHIGDKVLKKEDV